MIEKIKNVEEFYNSDYLVENGGEPYLDEVLKTNKLKEKIMKTYEILITGKLIGIQEVDEDETEESIDQEIEMGDFNIGDPEFTDFIVDENSQLTIKDANGQELLKIDSMEDIKRKEKAYEFPSKYILSDSVFEISYMVILEDGFDINQLMFHRFIDEGIDLYSIKYINAIDPDTNRLLDWKDFDLFSYLSTWSRGYELVETE